MTMPELMLMLIMEMLGLISLARPLQSPQKAEPEEEEETEEVEEESTEEEPEEESESKPDGEGETAKL